MATFRGYADQRHVTVLALRDERHRNREVSAELHALADTASAVSHLLISAGLKPEEERQRQNSAQEEEELLGSDDNGWGRPTRNAGSSSTSSSRHGDVRAAQDTYASDDARGGGEGGGAQAARQASSVSDTAGGGAAASAASEDQLQAAQERMCVEAIRRALAEARIELERRGRVVEEEREARRAVEGRVAVSDRAVLVAEERAAAAEVAAAKCKGRVSVLESNVDYLKRQQRSLRWEPEPFCFVVLRFAM